LKPDFVVLFYEFNAFLWRIDKGTADCFKNLWSLKQPIEVTVIDCSLRVKEY